MPQAKGSNAQGRIYEEATYGTAPAAGTGLRLPITEITGGLTQPLIRSRALQGNRNLAEPDLDEKTVALTVGLQPDVRSIAFVLKHLLGSAAVAGVGPYTHTIKVADTLPIGLTFEKYFSDIAIALQYVGCKIDSMTFESGPGGLLEITLQVSGADETNTAVIDATPTLYAIQPFRLPKLIFTEGGAAAKATRFTMTIANQLDPVRTIGADGKVTSMMEGQIAITGSFTALFEDMTLYNKAKNGTESSVKINFPAKTAGHSLEFEVPELRYGVTSPPISGPGGVLMDMGFEAFLDNDAGASSVIARVINDVASITTIP